MQVLIKGEKPNMSIALYNMFDTDFIDLPF